jgi:hypothetical protein
MFRVRAQKFMRTIDSIDFLGTMARLLRHEGTGYGCA